MQNSGKEKIALAMSGGVDSTVCALLLQQQGYEVIGVTMLTDGVAVGQKAAQAAAQMGIEHHIYDGQADFAHFVLDNFKSEYEQGRTPNPCVVCNRHVKFGTLFEFARSLGCAKFATGHYARVEQFGARYAIRRAAYLPKDQSYVLYALPQAVLSRLVLPLGELSKEQVRELALQAGLSVATQKDSQDICFIPDGNYHKYLLEHGVRSQRGNFVDLNGRVLGQHEGVAFYTIGQRRGMGLALGYPAYVVAIRPQTNEVVVGTEDDLCCSQMTVTDCNFALWDRAPAEVEVLVKIRYRTEAVAAILTPQADGNVLVRFLEQQRAVTPGQAAVFYSDELVLGGGTIM